MYMCGWGGVDGVCLGVDVEYIPPVGGPAKRHAWRMATTSFISYSCMYLE